MGIELRKIKWQITATDNTRKVFARIKASLNTLKVAAKGISVVFGAVAAGVTATVIAFKNFQRNIDATAKAADKLGVATEALQAIHKAAGFAGISTNNVTISMQRMVRRVAEAATGTGSAVKALKELGLNAKELNAAGPEKAFDKILTSLENVESQTDKVRLAFKLFDSGGVDLVRLTSSAIKQAADEMERFGLTITRQQAAAVEFANDQLDRVNALFDGVREQIAVGMANSISVLSQHILNTTDSLDGVSKKTATLAQRFTVFVGHMLDVWDGFVIGLNSVNIFMDKIFITMHKGISGLAKNIAGFEFLPDTIANGLLNIAISSERMQSELHRTSIELQKDNARRRERNHSDELRRLFKETEAQVALNAAAAATNRQGGVSPLLPIAPMADSPVTSSENVKTEFEETCKSLKKVAKCTEDTNKLWGTLGTTFTSVAGFFGSAASAIEGRSQKMFKVFQRVQIAIATVAGVSAQIQSLADITQPTLLQKLGAYATIGGIVASGIASLNSINVGSSGGSISTSAPAASTSQQAVNQSSIPFQDGQSGGSTTIVISGNGLYTSEMVENLVDELNQTGLGRKIDVKLT